ncbi:MAG: FtsQ-type POTRA domain-containing protein [Desulfocapsa sp.]|nr:FtsQ-type POTRA domain-containing protein [Desulfocapsa sp.]
MKSFKFLEKISILAGGEKKSETPGSIFSQKINQHTHYNPNCLGGEKGRRKKIFREKWQARSKYLPRQESGRPSRQKNEKRFGRPLQLVLLVSLVLLAGNLVLKGPGLSIFGNWNYFRIHDIEISGCRMTGAKGLKKYAEISYQMNMLTIDPQAIKERLEDHPWVVAADIRRIWPDGLAITIREYQPQALIATANDEALRYMDNNGVVFAPVASGQELDFPVITGLDTFNTSEEREDMLAAATSFLRLAKLNNPNLPAQDVSEIHFTENGEMVLYLVKHPFPIYFGKEGIKRKYYQLRKVLEVLYRKENGRAIIEKVAYIRMNYQHNKVLVVQNYAG